MQALKSKPLFLLVSPIYSASQMMCMNQLNMTLTPFKLNELDGALFFFQSTSIPKWNHATTDVRTLISKVAEQTGIPWQNVIDSGKLIKRDYTMMADSIHTNEHGNGVLAQEIYMRLAFSQQLKERIDNIIDGNMSVVEIQDFLAQDLKKKSMIPQTKGHTLAQQPYIMTPISADMKNNLVMKCSEFSA